MQLGDIRNSTYQRLEEDDSKSEAGTELEQRSTLLKVRSSYWYLFFLGVSLLLIGTCYRVVAPRFENSSSPSSCSSCTYEQCLVSTCGTAAPFLCLSGAATHGCTSIANGWTSSGICSSCCDMTGCKETILNGLKSSGSKCDLCTSAQCLDLSAISDQKCGSTAPYVCTAGSARMGCSASELEWLSVPTTECRFFKRYLQ